MMEKFSDVLIVVGISDMLKNKGSKLILPFIFNKTLLNIISEYFLYSYSTKYNKIFR